MTTLEASNLIYNWFSKKDIFQLNNIKDIILITESKQNDTAAVISALKDFVKFEVLDEILVEGEKVWVLKRPYASMDQTIKISAVVANEIAAVINKTCEENNNTSEMCDATNLKEKDIINLLIILKMAVEDKLDQEEKNE